MIIAASISKIWGPMDYKNTETKLDTLVSYFNDERINLNPVFQRGSVWNLKTRRELIKNIVRHRPIPAIFLYKDEAGSQYTFNILDGKQRLESILMFVGYERSDLSIKTWNKYILEQDLRKDIGFSIDIGENNSDVKFIDLKDDAVRNLREYAIPTIEITLNDNTSLDEIISLFVDINQYGVKVSRLKIIRALKANDSLLNDVYAMVAFKERRQQAILVKRKRTDFVYVLRHVQTIGRISEADEQADRMWERLFEFALFVRSRGQHRKPSEILKSFIKRPLVPNKKLSAAEKGSLKKVFDFLTKAYRNTALGKTRLATDNTHFYTMVTSLLSEPLIDENSFVDLTTALDHFGKALSGEFSTRKKQFTDSVKSYRDLAERQTSDVSRRKQRQIEFLKAVQFLLKERPA